MSKPREPKLWDRRPWPKNGVDSKEVMYAAVGQALSHWERYEVALAILFATFVSPFNSYAARRAYVAVRTFEGRADMLRAASSAYFDEMPNAVLQEDFKNALRTATNLSPRRNDIAHAIVDIFVPEHIKHEKGTFTRPQGSTYALYPSFASFKERNLIGMPSYCMVVEDLDYFAQQFENSIGPAMKLQEILGSIWNTEVALRYKRLEPDQK